MGIPCESYFQACSKETGISYLVSVEQIQKDGHGDFCSLSLEYTDSQMLKPLIKVVQLIPC